jgi:hypothetical protein
VDALLARPRGRLDARLVLSRARSIDRVDAGALGPEQRRPAPREKEMSGMRSRIALAVLAVLVSVALVVTLSMAAGPKQYQWTGTVTELDAKEKIMAVDKGGDVWQFSTEGLKDLKVKKGDKVTVHYVAIAKKIEMK